MSTPKPKSPSSDSKYGVASPVHKSPSLEFEKEPPSSAIDNEMDGAEFAAVLKSPPNEAKTEPAWKSYVDAGFLTKADVNVWTEFMSCAPDDLEAHLQERGANIAQSFLKLLSKITNADTRKYVLAVLDDCCLKNKRRWGALFNNYFRPRDSSIHAPTVAEQQKEQEAKSILFAADNKHAPAAASRKQTLMLEATINPYATLFSVLRQETLDAFSQARVLHILATLFAYGSTTPRPGSGKTGEQVAAEFPELVDFQRYLITKLNGAKGRELSTALTTTKDLLKNPDVRRQFIELGGLRALDAHFRTENETRNTQLTYVACFSVWLLTYNKDLLPELAKWGLIGKTNKIITSTNREKVLRLGFAILINVSNRENFNEEMISNGLLKFIDALGGRKIKDEDLLKDIEDLKKNLEEAMLALTSFEKYMSEVDSGELKWSPVHVEQFWRENNAKFEEKSFEYIKKVIALLDVKDNDTTLAVACSDLGEFARFHPDGKRVITQYDGKKKLMLLMGDKKIAPKVASSALLAVQKLMVHNWEHLAPGKKKDAKDNE